MLRYVLFSIVLFFSMNANSQVVSPPTFITSGPKLVELTSGLTKCCYLTHQGDNWSGERCIPATGGQHLLTSGFEGDVEFRATCLRFIPDYGNGASSTSILNTFIQPVNQYTIELEKPYPIENGAWLVSLNGTSFICGTYNGASYDQCTIGLIDDGTMVDIKLVPSGMNNSMTLIGDCTQNQFVPVNGEDNSSSNPPDYWQTSVAFDRNVICGAQVFKTEVSNP